MIEQVLASGLKYVRPEFISMRDHPQFNELWVENRIKEDPLLLGLGDLIVKDVQRLHAGAGRLDLLLQEPDSNRRYEVEIQLGRTDESHIIRTIEYWDIERKRYPQYDHTAVIVAESITSRFLNVVSLFNGFIPLVAIQMRAVRTEGCVTLVCTTVLDQMRLGLVDEDEGPQETVDRAYWEKYGSKATLATADEVLDIIRSWDAGWALKYNKHYIGLAKNGQPSNFVVFHPKKKWLRFEPRLEKSDHLQARLEDAGLDVMEYDSSWGRYRIRLLEGDVKKHEQLIRELLKQAYDEATG